MPLRYLFLDMNAFFASCEQQRDPKLRGRPVAVIPTKAETTACIAASYEAKAFGVKTGTPVWEARRMCPGLVCVEADHKRYVITHNRILDALGWVLPVDRVMSIDEMSCRLTGDERRPENVKVLAHRIKQAIYQRAGEVMHCSIGVGPNVTLAKVAADMKKPNGLTILGDDEFPQALYRLTLRDFPGIGPRMERRLNLYGVFSVQQLCGLSVRALSEVWGSKVLGGRWHRTLRGEDVLEPLGRRQTVSHSHVLPPDLRNDAGAYGILVRLTHKAAARMRKIDYWAGAVSVGLSFADEPAAGGGWGRGGWAVGCRLQHCQDTLTILRAVAALWEHRPKDRVPFKVGMVLSELRPARSATPSLFEADRRAAEASKAMDAVNAEFGASVIHLGAMTGYETGAPNRIAFTQIPDFDRRVS